MSDDGFAGFRGYVVPDNIRRFFTAAGFVHLPGVLADHVSAVEQAFEEVFAAATPRRGSPQRIGLPAIASRHPLLRNLLVSPIAPVVEQLVGSSCTYIGGDGTIYLDDNSYWHRDGHHQSAVIVKAVTYLEPTTRHRCLRFIPGSHGKKTNWRELEENATSAEDHFGIHAEDLPSITVRMSLGDVVVFDTHILHAFYGGAGRRRQVAWSFAAAPTNAVASAEVGRYLLADRSVV